MSNDEFQRLLRAWGIATSDLMSKMRDFQRWPTPDLRRRVVERTRGEADSIFARLDLLETVTPMLVAAIIKMKTALPVQSLLDLVGAVNDGVDALLSSRPSVSLLEVERSYTAAGQLVGAIQFLTVDDGPGEPSEPAIPGPPKTKPAEKVSDLKARGFERITVKKMKIEWSIGGDLLEDMAYRAMKDGHIYDDYQVLKPKKQNELWARRKR